MEGQTANVRGAVISCLNKDGTQLVFHYNQLKSSNTFAETRVSKTKTLLKISLSEKATTENTEK